MQHKGVKGGKMFFDLNASQAQVWSYFLKNPAQAWSVEGLARADAIALAQMGLLSQEGGSFRINLDSDAWLTWELTQAPAARRAVAYDSRVISEYRPNETQWLSDAQLKRMERASALNLDVARDAKSSAPVDSLSSAAGPATELPGQEKNWQSWALSLARASSNLENVSISKSETEALLARGERPARLSDQELRIVSNHGDAVEFLSDHAQDLSLDRRNVMDLHALLMGGLLADPKTVGALRQNAVRFDDSRYLPLSVPSQVREAFEEFCEKAPQIENPHEQAFLTMAFLPYLQPFQDGNKRTSRLAMNMALLAKKAAPFSFSGIERGDYMFGLLAVYERGRFGPLANAFADSYEKETIETAEAFNRSGERGRKDAIGAIAESSLRKKTRSL